MRRMTLLSFSFSSSLAVAVLSCAAQKPHATAQKPSSNSTSDLLADLAGDAPPSTGKPAAPVALMAPGSVTPAGGFDSKLPDEDVLPETIDPDPCRSPEQIKLLPGGEAIVTLRKNVAHAWPLS